MHELPCITVSVVTSGAICQWFSLVTQSRAKNLGKLLHEWPQKTLYMVTNVSFYFLHACNLQNSQQQNVFQAITISDGGIVAPHTRETGIVTSSRTIVLNHVVIDSNGDRVTFPAVVMLIITCELSCQISLCLHRSACKKPDSINCLATAYKEGILDANLCWN